MQYHRNFNTSLTGRTMILVRAQQPIQNEQRLEMPVRENSRTHKCKATGNYISPKHKNVRNSERLREVEKECPKGREKNYIEDRF